MGSCSALTAPNQLLYRNPISSLIMPKGSGMGKPMKLSADLADIVGKKEASRAECIKELWAYLKKNNLQDPANKQFFTPDKKMAKVFGTDRIRAFGMAKFLSAHLSQEVTARNTQHLEPTKKNPAPKGDQREKKKKKKKKPGPKGGQKKKKKKKKKEKS